MGKSVNPGSKSNSKTLGPKPPKATGKVSGKQQPAGKKGKVN